MSNDKKIPLDYDLDLAQDEVGDQIERDVLTYEAP